MEEEFHKLRREGVPWMDDIQFLKGEYLDRITGISEAKAATSCPVVSFWPYKFVIGLLGKCLNMGANLQTHTYVTKLSRPSENEPTILETSRGTIKANKVVFATNAYISALLPEYGNVIVPVRGEACHIKGKTPVDMPHLNYTYNIHHSPTSTEYMIPRPDGAVVLGGGQILYRDDRELWFDTVDDGTLITLRDGSDLGKRYFKGYMGRYFGVAAEELDFLWTGIQGYTPDGLPHIGAVPGKNGWFLLAGFNGGGMASIFEAARGIAQMVKDGRSAEAAGIPTLFIANEQRLRRGFGLEE
jgi:glycine/D-amino acid oxidase-like deaminating enzyme